MFIKAIITRSGLCLSGTLIILSQLISLADAQTVPAPVADQLNISSANLHTNFAWLGDTVNKAWEPNAVMLIPVKLPHCPQQFYMQFDLGAPRSVFYQAKMNTIKQKYPNSVIMTDSLQLTGQRFAVNGVMVQAKTIALKAYGNNAINWKSKNSYNIIGTIGADLLQNKTIVINYPKCKLQIGDSIPPKLKPTLVLTPIVYTQNSILLPVTLMGKRTMLFFDTGSSAFELLIDKQSTLTLARPGAQPTEHQVNSWGRILTAHTYATNDSLTMAGQRLPIKRATYIEGASDSQLDRMMKLGIGGMTGNKLFLNSVLIIDTKAKQFGIIPLDPLKRE